MTEVAKKYKALVAIIIFLVLTNVLLLIFFISQGHSERRPHSRDQNGLAPVLEKEVKFNKAQIDSYTVLRTKQRTDSRPLFDSLRNAKEKFYSLLQHPDVNDSTLDEFAAAIAQNQRQLDLRMFKYFSQVRSLCTPEQLPAFDTVMKKTVNKMIGGRGNSSKETNSNHK